MLLYTVIELNGARQHTESQRKFILKKDDTTLLTPGADELYADIVEHRKKHLTLESQTLA